MNSMLKTCSILVMAGLAAICPRLAPLHAADITTYGFGKGQAFTQSGQGEPTAAPGNPFFFHGFANSQESGVIQFVYLLPPGSGFPKTLTPNDDGTSVT